MQKRGLAFVLLFFLFLVTACGGAATPEGGTVATPVMEETQAEAATTVPEAEPTEDVGLLDASDQEIDTTGVGAGEASVVVSGTNPITFTATPRANDLGDAGWQLNVLDEEGAGTIQLSFPKDLGTGEFEVVSTAEAMGGTAGFGKVAVQMVLGQGADIQSYTVEGGRMRIHTLEPLTAELTVTAPDAAGESVNVTVIFNAVPLATP